jgi:glucarate dehydratase
MNDSYSFSVGKVGGTTKVIVEVETSDGIVGVGETFPLWTKDIIDHVIRPSLVGENPFNMERIAARCLPTNANPSLPYVDFFHLLALGGVEMALWDVMGKAVGLPSAMLMGGIYRTEIPFTDYVFVSGHEGPEYHIEEVARYSRELVTRYHSPTVEFKVGVLTPQDDIKMVEAVRGAVGEGVAMRVDANCAWTESTALRTIREIEKYDLANIEEPCGTLEANARVRRTVKTPISTHSTHVSDVVGSGLDAVVINPLQVGGFTRLKKQVAIAEDAGLDIWLHSRAELGFGTAAYLHFIAANRFVTLPSQTLLRPTEHMLTREGKPDLINGKMKLPTGSGLGVTLDYDMLEKYNSHFKEVGEYNWLSSSGLSPPFH